MSPEKINIAIAQWCGWCHRLATQDNPAYRHGIRLPNTFGPDVEAFWKEGVDGVYASPPDFYHDLNAINEAVSHLSFGQRGYYNAELFKAACNGRSLSSAIKEPDFIFKTVNAISPQRCEALLRTVELWV